MKEKLLRKNCMRSCEKMILKKDFGKRIEKERLWGILKDRLWVWYWKRKPVEIWKVISNYFPPFLQSQKKWVTDKPTDGPMDRPTDQQMDIPSYRDAWTHLKNDFYVLNSSLEKSQTSCPSLSNAKKSSTSCLLFCNTWKGMSLMLSSC